MERKIKKQSLFYGLTAILLASLLTAMILNFDLIQLDYTPGDLPSGQSHHGYSHRANLRPVSEWRGDTGAVPAWF